MIRSKLLIAQALSTLQTNIERTGDPLGFRRAYWTRWAEGLNLPKKGKTVLFTARMYQMLPFVVREKNLVSMAKVFLAVKGLDRVLSFCNRVAGETILRITAWPEKKIMNKGEKILRGITAYVRALGLNPAYLYEEEPYSGVLLYELGLTEAIAPHVHKVYNSLKKRGVETVITVDPHTTFMMRKIYPRYIEGFDIDVKHYLELPIEQVDEPSKSGSDNTPGAFVVHDACVMTRSLEIEEPAKKLAEKLGIRLIYPENSKKDTACCGGPIEYVFGALSHEISKIRIGELAALDRNILVTCPICLINLRPFEKSMNTGVWDLGEVLFEAFQKMDGHYLTTLK